MTHVATTNAVSLTKGTNNFTIQTTKTYKIPQKWFLAFADRILLLEVHGKIFAEWETVHYKVDGDKFAEIIQHTDMESSLLETTDAVVDLCFGDIDEDNAELIAKEWKKWVNKKIAKFAFKKKQKNNSD